jgi:hypothetical protein
LSLLISYAWFLVLLTQRSVRFGSEILARHFQRCHVTKTAAMNLEKMAASARNFDREQVSSKDQQGSAGLPVGIPMQVYVSSMDILHQFPG